MILTRTTRSLCPVCLKEIPATIRVDHDVTMFKSCPDHGSFEALLERDPIFYLYVNGLGDGSIYDGLILNVSDSCNTFCKHCYFGVSS